MERNSNKGLKKLVLLLLLFVGLGASVTAGAYWASNFSVTLPGESTGTVTVKVGVGQEITVSTSLSAATSGDTKVLVPAGFVVDEANQTATKSFTVTASWTMGATDGFDEDDVTQNYKIVVGDYVIKYTGTETSLDQDAYDLFSVDIAFTVSEAIELGGENIIRVTVTMAEPDNVEIYNKVADKDITITFSLNVVGVWFNWFIQFISFKRKILKKVKRDTMRFLWLSKKNIYYTMNRGDNIEKDSITTYIIIFIT